MKDKILKIIAESFPYSIKEVHQVYDIVKSFDITCVILSCATTSACGPIELAHHIKE